MSVKSWAGPATPRVALVVHVVGVSVALTSGVMPVPLSTTGEPVTVTLAVMGNVAFTKPSAFGENTTLMVQVPPAAKVVPQVPPDRV